MTIYEGITLGFIGVGIIFIILSLFFDKTKKVLNEDEASMEEDRFRTQISLVNDKIIELNDYHTFVQDEIEKKHKELLFLYQMISEKEKTIREISVEIEKLQDAKNLQGTMTIQEVEKTEVTSVSSGVSISSEPSIDSGKTRNQRIIELKGKGYDSKEIAKILDIGQGEVRLVLNLFE